VWTSVQVTAAAVIDNTTGNGVDPVQVYFSKDSASVYTTNALHLSNATITGPHRPRFAPAAHVGLTLDSVFNADKLWVGVPCARHQERGSGPGRAPTAHTLSLRHRAQGQDLLRSATSADASSGASACIFPPVSIRRSP